jgi:hypothetical protein
VDDYRLDAVKFPFPEFIAAYTRMMREHLASLNRPEPYIVGEWSHGGIGDSKSLRFANQYQIYGTNILDFALSLKLNQFIEGNYAYSGDQITAFDLDNFLHERVVPSKVEIPGRALSLTITIRYERWFGYKSSK